MPRQTDSNQVFLAAIVSAGAMIAFQVGGKATRDALFLSTFPATALPAMLIASSPVAILAVLVASHLITTKGPGAVIPATFGASSILLVAEWIAFSVTPRAAAVALYLHMAAFGAILISGFWSVISELFDPRTAKAKIGRIAAGGTLGGLIGGVIAERTGTLFSVSSMLPVLAVLHFACAILNLRLRKAIVDGPGQAKADQRPESARSGLRVLSEVPYMKHLAVLVLLGTVAEVLLDFVLKIEASAVFSQGPQLLRFFALFYTGISLVTFLVQAAVSQYSLRKLGVTATMSTMPFTVAAGGVGALIWPGLLSIGFVRGAESVFRSSLFRSGYELMYTPVPLLDKRSAKTIVDVGFDKCGDAVGGGVIRIVLALGLGAATNSRLLTAAAVTLGILSVILTTRLRKGYVATLESSLLNQAAELDLLNVDERTTRATMLRTLGTVDLRALRLPQRDEVPSALESSPPRAGFDSVVKRIVDLQSENADVVRAALTTQAVLEPLLVEPAIRLLARDDVSEFAVKALRTRAESTIGQLTDALLNPDEDFAIRRRLPRILAHCSSVRAIEGLMRGLADDRFEVRFSCGRALSKICGVDPTLRPDAESVYSATLKEITIATRLSEMPRIIDRYEDHGDSSSDELWNTTDIRLEHIFRLLSLSLPKEPLHVSFQALHTDDAFLRGTALEYLETILPPAIRDNLWHFLEGTNRPAANRRPADRVLEELMQSRNRIELKLSLVKKAESL